jgi:F-type H+-transporting ATPase subunit b
VIHILTNVAHASEAHLEAAATATVAETGGLSALGLDWKSFLFQLATFVLLLLILRKWAFPVLVKTLEDRRSTIEKSIDQAKQTQAAMQNAEKQIEKMLAEARDEAAELVTVGHKEAAKMVEEAEEKAVKRAEHIVKEAHAGMEHELNKARTALKQETAQLVAEATGAILKEKVDAKKNVELISKALKGSEKDRK